MEQIIHHLSLQVANFLASFPYAETTKDTYHRVLMQLILLPSLNQLSAADLLKFISKPEWGNSQRYTALCACKKFLRWSFGANHPALSAQIKRIPTPPKPRLSGDQMLQLISSFDISSPAGKRDLAIALVALDCNLRASELCNLELENVHLDQCKLFALVKGGQWAWKTFSPATAKAIQSWLEVRSPALGVHTLFISFQHQHLGKPLTREGLQIIMRRWGRAVGFHISPHMFRRSYASLSTLNGAPKNIVKLGGGWKSDEVVNHYIGDLELEATRPYLPVANLTK
jgi:integrase/recombinase XerD